MAGVPVSVMSAVWKGIIAAGVKHVGAVEHNAIIAALSPCFTPDYLDGINGWPLVPAEDDGDDVSPIGDTSAMRFAAWVQQARRLEGDHGLDLPFRTVCAAACNAADRAYAGLVPVTLDHEASREIARLKRILATIRADVPEAREIVDRALWPDGAPENGAG